MTREEEIKEWKKMTSVPNADVVATLIARNEELQRRVEELRSVLKSVEWEGGYNIDGKYTCPSCQFTEKHYSQCRLYNSLKEHPDA